MERDWIEIGSLLSGVRFQVSVSRDGTRKVGYRVRPSMTHTTNSDYLCKLVGRDRIPSKGIYRKRSDLEKCLSMDFSALVPGLTTSLEAWSASTTCTPNALKASATVLLPLPIPPVRPTIYGCVVTINRSQ